MKSERLAEWWTDCSSTMIHNNVPGAQTKECRFAFYAGALAFYRNTTPWYTIGTKPTAEDIAQLSGLVDEIIEYFKSMGMVFEDHANPDAKP